MSLFAVFDFETTGRFPERGDRIVEIAAVVLDDQFRVVRIFDSLVNPQRRIPTESRNVHRITELEVAAAPTFSELLPELHDCFQGITHLVAHNSQFDLRFLKAAFTKSGEPFPEGLKTVCTLQKAKKFGIGSEDNSQKLSMVAEALQIPVVADAHQAIVDAGVTARIFSMLCEESPITEQIDTRWPVRDFRNKTSRQMPRQSISISCQQLAMLGLSVNRSLCENVRNEWQRNFSGSPNHDDFVPGHNVGLSSAQVAELKSRVKVPEAMNLGIKRPHPEMNDTASWTFYLFNQMNKDVAAIARERSLEESTVYSHLADAVRHRIMNISCLATVDQIQRIAEARASLPDNETRLKPLFEALNGEYSYGLLRCVIASLDENEQSLS